VAAADQPDSPDADVLAAGRRAITPRGEADYDREERVGAGLRSERDYDRSFRRDEEDEDYPRRRYEDEPVGSPDDLSANYEIDLHRWFEYAKAHWGDVVGPAIGFQLLQFVISQAAGFVPFLGALLSIAISIPLQAGMIIVCLAQLKGKPWTFGDFFGGFNKWGQVIALAILQGLIIGAAIVPGVIAGIIAGVVMYNAMGNPRGGPPPEAFLAAAPFVLFSLLLAMYLGVRLSFFAVPLLFDRNFGPIEAMTGSWKLSRGHTLGLIGVALLMGLINIAGLFLCGFGILLAIPYTTLATTAGYLLIAGSRPPVLPGRRRREPDEPRDDRDADDD
jgi:uncharacterized membrane protein